MVLTDADKQALMDVRKKKRILDFADERYKDAKELYLKAQTIDGMPKGSTSGAGLEIYVMRRDKALEEFAAAQMAYLSAVAKAHTVIDKIVMQIDTLERVSRIREFCKAYFIESKSVRKAALEQGIAESTAWGYKREIVGEMKNE